MSNFGPPITNYDLGIIKRFHWTKSLIENQYRKQHLVRETPAEHSIKTLLTVATYEKNNQILAGGILYDQISNQYSSVHCGEIIKPEFPYIPSLLSIRHKHPLLGIIEHFQGDFDLLLVKGAGLQHPRFFGLACEIGVGLDVPTIGITKRGLCGTVDFHTLVTVKSHNSPTHDVYKVWYADRIIANFIRKKGNSSGMYLSVGHRTSLPSVVPKLIPLFSHQKPEPLRLLKSYLRTVLKKVR